MLYMKENDPVNQKKKEHHDVFTTTLLTYRLGHGALSKKHAINVKSDKIKLF